MWRKILPEIVKLQPSIFSLLKQLDNSSLKSLIEFSSFQEHEVTEKLLFPNGGIVLEGKYYEVDKRMARRLATAIDANKAENGEQIRKGMETIIQRAEVEGEYAIRSF